MFRLPVLDRRCAFHAIGRRTIILLSSVSLILCSMFSLAQAGEAPPGKKKVVFWNLFTTSYSHSAITEIVKRFNDSSKVYWVEKIDIPYQHIHSKMLPAIAGGTPPDVSIFDRFLVASYAARSAFEPLDDRIKADGIRGEDFFEAPWGECIYNKHQFAVPYDTDVRVMYYNKKMFREAGLDPEKPPQTWSELREYSRKLTKRSNGGKLDQVGCVPIWGNTGGLYLYGWQKGAQFMSDDGRKVMLDEPANVAALEWVHEFIKEYGIEDLAMLQTGFGMDAQNPFITGKIAMIAMDVGELSTIQKYGKGMEWGVAPCPYADDGQPATWSGGFSMVIPKGAQNADGGWELCKFIMSEE